MTRKIKISTLESEERRIMTEALNCYADAETDKESARRVLELAKRVRRNEVMLYEYIEVEKPCNK